VFGSGPRISETGAPRFDTALPGPLSYPQSATPFLRWAYQRPDLWAVHPESPHDPLIKSAGAAGLKLIFREPAFKPASSLWSASSRFAWDEVVPLVIDSAGHVRFA